MPVKTSAGTTLHVIAGDPATFDDTGYGTLFGGTEAKVGEITDLGEFGREYSLVTHNPIGERGTKKFKGSYNEGQITLQLGLDNDDAGQNLMEEARDSDDNYSFMVTLPSGDIYYFQAQVMSFKIGIGQVDSITSASCTLELTTASDGTGVVKKLAA